MPRGFIGVGLGLGLEVPVKAGIRWPAPEHSPCRTRLGVEEGRLTSGPEASATRCWACVSVKERKEGGGAARGHGLAGPRRGGEGKLGPRLLAAQCWAEWKEGKSREGFSWAFGPGASGGKSFSFSFLFLLS